jgi:lysophospholipase L1-like esterase
MTLVTDDNGFSITPSFSFANPDVTIVTTGGSTIFGVGSSDNASTVPSILERLINQRLNIRAEVVNVALRGAQSFQEMLLVNRFLAENRADLVLAITGRNDASAYFHDPTVEGSFLNKTVWHNAVPLVHRAERSEFVVIGLQTKLRTWSYTYDLLYRWLGPSKNSKRPVDPPKPNLRREAVIHMEKRAKITATHFVAADQISKMYGAGFVLILQPTLFDKDTWTEEEIRRITKMRQIFGPDGFKKYQQNEDEFYDALIEIEKPYHFIDLSNIFLESKETLFIDNCHYNDLAAEKFAEKIFESIQPLLRKIKAR